MSTVFVFVKYFSQVIGQNSVNIVLYDIITMRLLRVTRIYDANNPSAFEAGGTAGQQEGVYQRGLPGAQHEKAAEHSRVSEHCRPGSLLFDYQAQTGLMTPERPSWIR